MDPNGSRCSLVWSRAATPQTPSYRPSAELSPWIDLHPDQKLRAISSDLVLEPAQAIVEDLRVEAEVAAAGDDPDASEAAGLIFNCEHVVPQSWFAKPEPMRGDLHHLFVCEPGCNSFRGNIAYSDFADFPNREVTRNRCGRRETARFEPEAGKGTGRPGHLVLPAPLPLPDRHRRAPRRPGDPATRLAYRVPARGVRAAPQP